MSFTKRDRDEFERMMRECGGGWFSSGTITKTTTTDPLTIPRMKDRIAALERKVKALTEPKPEPVAALRPEDV